MLWYDKPIPRHFKKHDHDGDIDLAQYEHDEAHKDKHINDGIVDASGDLALKPVAYHGNSRIFNELLLIGNNNKKYPTPKKGFVDGEDITDTLKDFHPAGQPTNSKPFRAAMNTLKKIHNIQVKNSQVF
ncbi:hypothetical protein TruAng_007796 [Truncatella angustata]|nr:hypothetical protein TruAng_007796 [Truncatella angustata]